MKIPNKRQVVAATLTLVLLATEAHAQVIGGGGGGLIQPIIQWFVANIVAGLIAIAVLVVGGMLLFGRHTMAGIAVMVVGALIVVNYQAIAGLFPTGG